MTLGFAVVAATGVDHGRLGVRIGEVAGDVVDALRQEGSAALAVAAAFDEFFAANGHRSPLSGQLRGAAKKGFRDAPAPVRSLLVAEAATGVLMGVQDGDAVRGRLVLERLDEPESFEGMRATVHCGAGEPVVRDDAGIVASVFQGPDRRTAVGPASTHLVYPVFGYPGFDGVGAAAQWVCDLVAPAAEQSSIEMYEVPR